MLKLIDILFLDYPIYAKDNFNSASVYVQTQIPDSWSNLETACQSSGGHLLTVENRALERQIAENAEFKNYWCGGNICPDTPAPAYSMWSSGKSVNYMNFADDSMLDGSHCCVKLDVYDDDRNKTSWKGENCQRIMQGICEFHVKGQFRC